MNERKEMPMRTQIRRVRFLTDVLLQYEKTDGAWASEKRLYESMPFLVNVMLPGGKEKAICGCVEYAPANGSDLQTARQEVIGHGRRYAGRHIDTADLRELPSMVYSSFAGRKARMGYAGPLNGGHFGSY